MRVWIDTDVGDNPDDAVALLVAARHPDVELAGVSTVSGDGERRVETARSLLRTTTPVVAGGIPLDPQVVAIGPLTNVAAAGPSFVTLMGGALGPVRHRGGIVDVESNFAKDPAAARTVLSVPGRRLVPLDVTTRMVLDRTEVETLRGVHAELGAEIDAWPHEVCLHDPLTLLVAIGDVEFEERPMALAVDDDGRVLVGEGTEHMVVVSADVDGARRRILDIVAP